MSRGWCPTGRRSNWVYGAIPEAVTAGAGGDERTRRCISARPVTGWDAGLQGGTRQNSRHKEIDPGITVAMMLMGGPEELYPDSAERNAATPYPLAALYARRAGTRAVPPLCRDQLGAGMSISVRTSCWDGVGGGIDRADRRARSISSAPPIARPRAGRSSRCNPTNRDRSKSRIVARLRRRRSSTTARADADCVVTEGGIAELRGCTLAERAEALIAVADPAFRAELRRESNPAGGSGGMSPRRVPPARVRAR